MPAIAVLHRRTYPVARDAPGDPPTADRHPHHAVVRVEGELDAAVVGEFRKALDQALTPGSRAVILDFGTARFLSIEAAHDLVEAKRHAAVLGVDLRIVAGRREVERVLEVTGARPLFRYYPSVQTALRA
ncbi:STAS domain-containing protein [Nocardia terpenica]|uniref:STAS domain-containing protein n=1 Tax=Nocardia terpenica TaxID=455432 RepID=UPI00083220AC|nr:STAS domain-containing protein [Nocardia terpenica]NQE91827.1 STAS domain-containing protein [Nocardia terpenica]